MLLARTALARALLVAVALAGLAPAAQQAQAPDRVLYRMRMTNPARHLFEIEISTEARGDEPVELQMPAWSPGRYVIYDFALAVQNVHASDAEGRALPVEKVDKQTWRARPDRPGRLTFSYDVYADDLSGTFSQLDGRHGNFNGASVFMYVVGRKSSPVRLEISPPAGWRVINGRATSADQTAFDFENYDLLVDTPTEIAPDFELRTFQADGVEYRVVTHQLGPRADAAKYVADVERIVRAQNAVLGAPPDMQRFTFLVHFAPAGRSGDGMEHLDATQIVRTASLGDQSDYAGLLSVTSHEYFHVWNVKRLRPVELGPWDYTRENYTTSLWIAEGITSYYGDLSLARAGLLSEQDFYGVLAGEVEFLQGRPGRLRMSAERSSFDTWLYVATDPRQRVDTGSIAIDYYNKGELLGLLLDLEIRHRTKGERSLDDVMRLMYRRFFLDAPAENYYYKGRGYRGEDFLRAVEEVSGSEFSDWFARYVSGTEELDYDRALEYAGLGLERRSGGGFAIVPLPRATADQLALRRAWLSGGAARAAQR